MAGIDKTYVTSYEEYKEIIDWAKDHTFVCPNGIKFHVIHFCYLYSEEDIKEWLKDSKTIPIMNTPLALDYFLIKHCPIKTIQNQMREVYSKEYIDSIINGISEYDTFIRPLGGKHVKILNKPRSKRPTKWFSSYRKEWNKSRYRISNIKYPNEEYSVLAYNRVYDKVLLKGELGYITSSGMLPTKCKSLKSLINKLIKWDLPIGTIIEACGYYEGEEVKLLITK